jgi:hypothetical protein
VGNTISPTTWRLHQCDQVLFEEQWLQGEGIPIEHAGNDETHQPNAIELVWDGKNN